MSVYSSRPMAPPASNRLMEMLDTIKAEYDQLAQEVAVCKSQRDEYEHRSKRNHHSLFCIKRVRY